LAVVLRLRLPEALTLLPESQRTLLQAIYEDGKTQRQIASERGVQDPAVSKQHKKALEALRDFMARHRTWATPDELRQALDAEIGEVDESRLGVDRKLFAALSD
jgi:hypothetical protein